MTPTATELRLSHWSYLAGLGIPATAGFGARYVGLHAADERIQLDSLPAVQAVYHAATLAPLSGRCADHERRRRGRFPHRVGRTARPRRMPAGPHRRAALPGRHRRGR